MFIPNDNIKRVKYSILTDEEKIKTSVVEVKYSKVFIDDKNPFKGGVYDSKMGASEGFLCRTCGLDNDECPGHFGHIKLNYPIKVPLVSDDVIRWLKIICHNCGNPMTNIDVILNTEKGLRFDRIVALSSDYKDDHVCPICNKEIKYKPTKDKDNFLILRNTLDILPNGEFKKIFNEEILEVFKKINPKFCEVVLGFEPPYHPVNLFTSVIAVSPNNTRPEIKSRGSGLSTIDDITKQYQSLVEKNTSLIIKNKKNLNEEEERLRMEILKESLEELYYMIILADSDSVSSKKKIENSSGVPLKSFANKLEKKKGLIRNKTQGKKLEKCGRSVIVGETSAEHDVVIVGRKIAKELKMKVVVTSRNIFKLTYLLSRDKYPKVEYVERNNKVFNGVEFKRFNSLQIGDIVHRNLIDDDVVIFSRQPCLWWGNISAHRLKVIKGEWVYRFNEINCVHFNADFDGDDMNIYLITDVQSIVECKMLCNIKNWGMNFQNGTCMIGVKEDALLGLGLLTKSGVEFSYEFAQTLFNKCTIFPNVKKFIRSPNYKGNVTKGKFTGRDIVSILFLELGCTINYRKESRAFNKKFTKHLGYDETDQFLEFQHGHLISGIFDGSMSSQQKINTPFHVVFNDFGPKVATNLAFNLQQICMDYITFRGFTISIEDVSIDKDDMNLLNTNISDKVDKSIEIREKFISGNIISPINVSLDEHYENLQQNIFKTGDPFNDQFLKSIDKNNSYYLMASIGSKADINSMIRTIAFSGQSTLEGERIKKECGGRYSIYSTKESFDPVDRGLITNNLSTGLTTREALGMAIQDRDGIIKKSQDTSKTGYSAKLLGKSLDGIITTNYYSVNINTDVLMMGFGGDCLDPRKEELNTLEDLFLDDKELEKKYKTNIFDLEKIYNNNVIKDLLEDEFYKLLEIKKSYLLSKMNDNANLESNKLTNLVFSPIDLKRVIENNLTQNKKFIIDPKKSIDLVEKYIRRLSYLITNENISSELPRYAKLFIKNTELIIRFGLSLKKIIERNISIENLNVILEEIYLIYSRSLITPGLQAGIVLSLSLSQPISQKMLKSIHSTGGKGGGIKDIEDITNAKKSNIVNGLEIGISNPYMRINLKDGVDTDDFINDYEMKRLESFIISMNVIYDHNIKNSNKYFKDQKYVDAFLKYNLLEYNISDLCVRLELDKMELIIKNISIENIISRLYSHFEDFKIKKKNIDVFILSSFMDDDKIIVYIYLVTIPDISDSKLSELLEEKINSCILEGVSGITKVNVVTKDKYYMGENGDMKKKEVKMAKITGYNPIVYNDDRVDKSSFATAVIREAAKIFGICFAENMIISELNLQIESSMNFRYYNMLAASMVWKGDVLPNTYHGIKKRHVNDASLQISTENFKESLKEAVKRNKISDINGLAPSLLYSSNIPSGTNYDKLIINKDFIIDNTKDQNEEIDDILGL